MSSVLLQRPHVVDDRDSGGRPFRVVIVGGGPRGLWALQELLRAADEEPAGRDLEIAIIEPHASPGAGWIYDPRQSSVLRMNLASRHVDCGGEATGSLVDWATKQGVTLDPEGFVPRATVGAYLAECFAEAVALAPPGVSVRVVRDRTLRVDRTPSTWRVQTASGQRLLADELLLTVGHAGSGPDTSDADIADIAGIYPVDDRLDESLVPPGSVVALRGFALTGLDAMLALTEGRGGRFRRDEDGVTYVPSGREPRVIRPFSRTGQPMTVKPTAAVNERPGAAAIWQRLRDDLDRTPPHVAAIESLVIEAAAARWKLDRGSQRMPARGLWQQLRDRLHTPAARESVCADWRASIAVARGERPIDLDHALGAAWRMLYPSIVAAVSLGQLPREQVAAFRTLATRLERFAFGPPIVSVERVLALAAAGLVDFTTAADPVLQRTEDGWQLGGNDCDVLIDARIASPGFAAERSRTADLAHGRRETLLGGLVARGQVTVDDDWQCLRTEADGTAAPHLAIIGRAAEGWLLGHDTLTRSLHDVIPRWAARVAERLAHQQSPVAVPLAAAAR